MKNLKPGIVLRLPIPDGSAEPGLCRRDGGQRVYEKENEHRRRMVWRQIGRRHPSDGGRIDGLPASFLDMSDGW